LEAGSANYGELNALCVWNKTSVTEGPLYPSKHELVLAYKNGTAPNINNSSRGRHKRQRTDVWSFSEPFQSGRSSGLDAAVKPVSLIAEAISDCSTRGGIILDPFAGSGTTILAAERTGRRAAALETNPCFVDIAIRRWEAMTGEKAVRAGGGETFEAVQAVRLSAATRP
jgi:DNA modification methylase